MATPTIDYDALAKQHGAVSSGVDYDALAKQHGAVSSSPAPPPSAPPVDTAVRDHLKDEGFLESAWNAIKSPVTFMGSLFTGEYRKAHAADYDRMQELQKTGTREQKREFAKEVLLKNIPGASTIYKLTQGNYAGAAGDVAGLAVLGGTAKAVAKAPAVAEVVKNSVGSVGDVLTHPATREAVGIVSPRAKHALDLATRVKRAVDALGDKPAAAPEPVAPAGPGEALAKAQGIDYAALSADERGMLDNAARAQANTTAQQPVGPRQPEPMPEVQPEAAAPPQAPGKTVADLLREELEAARAARPPQPQAAPAPAPTKRGHQHQPPVRLPQGYTRAGTLDPTEGTWTGARPLPRTGTAADYAPRPVAVEAPAPQVATPEAPPSPRQEVIPTETPAVPAAVEPTAPAALNPVEIGRRIMRSMGMEDVPAKDALQTFDNLRELSARTGKPIEELYQKYTGEPLTGVAPPEPEAPPAPVAPAAPRPLSPKQGEAAMFRTKEAQAPVNANLDPNEVRTFTAASGEQKSKALRAEEKKAYNADAKAKRFAEAFHAEGVTAEDVASMSAADAKAMTDGLIAKGLLKKGEMPPNSSMPRLIGHLKELERAKAEAPAPVAEAAPIVEAPAPESITVRREIPNSELDTRQLIDRLKSQYPNGTPSDTYGRFVKARDLKPEINVQQFAKYWENASPNAHVTTETRGFSPTHTDTVTGKRVQVMAEGGRHSITWENGMTGSDPGALADRYVPLAKAKPAETPVSRPAVDHSTLSPSGRVSKRAEAAAKTRTAKELFGDGRLKGPQLPEQPTEAAALRQQAKELRTLADRGQKPRAYAAKASELEAKADALEAGAEAPKPARKQRHTGTAADYATAAK